MSRQRGFRPVSPRAFAYSLSTAYTVPNRATMDGNYQVYLIDSPENKRYMFYFCETTSSRTAHRYQIVYGPLGTSQGWYKDCENPLAGISQVNNSFLGMVKKEDVMNKNSELRKAIQFDKTDIVDMRKEWEAWRDKHVEGIMKDQAGKKPTKEQHNIDVHDEFIEKWSRSYLGWWTTEVAKKLRL